MKFSFTPIIAAGVAILFSSFSMTTHADSSKPFTYNDKAFLLHGKPLQIISGEIHPQRIPRAYWRDRLEKARAMGLNSVTIYIFWNLLESQPGKWDFSGNNDIAEFVRDAQQEGLHVLLRPGPYVCAEWEFGGFPAWLLKEPNMKVRTRDPRFLKAMANYLKHVGEQLAPLQITHGGPIIMVQVENEYGSFGSDHEYMQTVKSDLVNAGFDTVFFTADGPGKGMIDGGTLPGVLSAMNFGGGAESAFKTRQEFHPGGPLMCGEFWAGWFDHWGEQHHTTSVEAQASELDWMLSHGASVSIYMFDGGTNFGFMNGANGGDIGGSYAPTTTSYDYDAPISEGGEPTKKFYAFRDVIAKHLAPGTKLPPLPAPIPRITLPPIYFKEWTEPFANLPTPIKNDEPLTMEQLDQSYGFTLYRTRVAKPLTGILHVGDGPRDRVIVFANGKKIAPLDRRYSTTFSPKIEIPAGATLNLLVENMGRINFGGAIEHEQKGIVGKVTVGGQELTDWEMFPLPMTDLSGLKFHDALAGELAAYMPRFWRGTFAVSEIGDTYLDMKGWVKGVVWVNGHNLGRYWNIGPQQALYLPGCWLKKGENTIVVFALETPEPLRMTVSGIKEPYFETHSDAPPRFPGGEKYKADLTNSHLVKRGTFAQGEGWQEIKFDKSASGRFVALQSLSAYGGEPFASVAELQLTDANGKDIPREKWKIVWTDSEELHAENGNADNIIDNQPDTLWHTQWSGAKPPHPHEIVIDLGAQTQISGFRYLPRKGNTHGIIKDYQLYVW